MKLHHLHCHSELLLQCNFIATLRGAIYVLNGLREARMNRAAKS